MVNLLYILQPSIQKSQFEIKKKSVLHVPDLCVVFMFYWEKALANSNERMDQCVKPTWVVSQHEHELSPDFCQ